MGGYSTSARRRSTGGVPLQVLRDEPVGLVPADAGGPGFDAEDAVGGDRQRIAPVEEDQRLVLGQHLVQPVVEAGAIGLHAGGAAGLQERVDLGVLVGDVVQVVGAALRRVPDDELVG